ncbi:MULTISPECIES: type II 3-dehydroquinate dehydratase [unclassified Sulfitobacter]|jgi:3-dehydroquinate dehydratase-2|uniref:type II 3-dehydroquinate dehydratase n=1 Tax=unclassified Sulfitobacter TaxID=196795 RepID=UPI0005696CDF|nr:MULTISPECIES: type II 3-dehydroquinate dehydratase [unclassified Sulfitobacter]PTB00480.1 type II 3-dehydroquinate dehydratase [Sulfitobacter sp. CB-A]ULO20273.1 type II 3-dehydroquinate dehydratase [Sulfitobacter sp. CB2047]
MSSQTIHILNGPNLNLLGTRQPEVYGRDTLNDVETLCRRVATEYDLAILFRQSNHEGELVEMIHEARTEGMGIVINPAAYTHTSIAIRDALVSCEIPIYEVHISNVHRREAFRHHSYVSGVATGVIAGLGIEGYAAAIRALSRTKKRPNFELNP